MARTYAYVANGRDGLAIFDVERPEQPHLIQMYTAEGRLNDVRAVQVGSVNASMFALVADGRNGLRVLQLISPENVPEHMGFSPRPNPLLIATAPLKHGEAIAGGRGLDRDRVVDETGAQTVVFGRRGSRPFNLAEMGPFLRHANGSDAPKSPRTGPWYRVEDVTLHKDTEGKPLLQTRSGAALLTPLAFRDPTAATGTTISTPAAAPTPDLAPLLPPDNPFLRTDDVQRLLQTLDLNRQPTSTSPQ